MSNRVLIYLLRRDLRLADNPVFHEISKLWSKPQTQRPFDSVLPIYIFAAQVNHCFWLFIPLFPESMTDTIIHA